MPAISSCITASSSVSRSSLPLPSLPRRFSSTGLAIASSPLYSSGPCQPQAFYWWVLGPRTPGRAFYLNGFEGNECAGMYYAGPCGSWEGEEEGRAANRTKARPQPPAKGPPKKTNIEKWLVIEQNTWCQRPAAQMNIPGQCTRRAPFLRLLSVWTHLLRNVPTNH